MAEASTSAGSPMDLDPNASTPEEDELVASIPIYYSEHLHPHIHLHQFQLQNRPLEVSPAARDAGKVITARSKPKIGRYEIHIPNDVRPMVWNAARGRALGDARYQEDKDEAELHEAKFETKEESERRLNDTRLISERVKHTGDYLLGVVRDGALHLHPITETHQFTPNLSYLDTVTKNQNRPYRPGGDSDSEDEGGPVVDADEASTSTAKKPAKKKVSTAKEVTVSRRAAPDSEDFGGLTPLRKEIIVKRRAERDEPWEAVEWHDEMSPEARVAFEKLFATQTEGVRLKTDTRMNEIYRTTLAPSE